jgi:hypothetical protein
VNRPFFDGLVDRFEDGGKKLAGAFLVLGGDEASDLLHLGPKGGFIPFIDRLSPLAAAALPDRGWMMSHYVLLKVEL